MSSVKSSIIGNTLVKSTFPPDARCPLCGGAISSKKTTFSVDLGKGILIVREVPAQICALCDEEWFCSDVSQRLDQLAADMREKGTEVEIISYSTPRNALAEVEV